MPQLSAEPIDSLSSIGQTYSSLEEQLFPPSESAELMTLIEDLNFTLWWWWARLVVSIEQPTEKQK